jgi:hypothetical protein
MFMKIRNNALYSDLLADLSDFLPGIYTSEDVEKTDGWPDMTVEQFAALALAKSLLKKFQERSNADADAAALDKFLQSNIQCKNWSLEVTDLKDELLVGLFRQEIYSFFNRGQNPIITSFNQILAEGNVGPGASVSAHGTDFYTKLFSSPLSCTSKGIYSVYEHILDKVPSWSRAEKLRSDQYGDYELVEGNRLSFVPKNSDISRVICTEPTLNMFFQQGVKCILEKRLRQFFGIDLSDQQMINRDLARIGSLGDNLSTIDLASASDTVSYSMIKEFLPRDIVSWLNFCRSPKCQLPNGKLEELHMISSMGNAFTFPLETVIFSCVVSAAYKAMDIPLIRKRRSDVQYDLRDGVLVEERELPNFGVFGDDIIVEKRATFMVMRLLSLLGFTVNTEKSFFEGPFRESCGGDYFRGLPVRGVYLKTLSSQASRFVAINRLNEWSAVTGIPLPRTVQYLVKRSRWLPVPLDENDDAGIKVPFDMIESARRCPDTFSIIYRKWQVIPVQIRIKDGHLYLPRGTRSRMYNPSGLLVSFLRGNVRADSITIRHGSARYRSKEAMTPNWERLPTVGTRVPIGRARLNNAIHRNLNR